MRRSGRSGVREARGLVGGSTGRCGCDPVEDSVLSSVGVVGQGPRRVGGARPRRRRFHPDPVETQGSPIRMIVRPAPRGVCAKLGLKWWPRPESNWRHPHFQCGALPTELPGHGIGKICDPGSGGQPFAVFASRSATCRSRAPEAVLRQSLALGKRPTFRENAQGQQRSQPAWVHGRPLRGAVRPGDRAERGWGCPSRAHCGST